MTNQIIEEKKEPHFCIGAFCGYQKGCPHFELGQTQKDTVYTCIVDNAPLEDIDEVQKITITTKHGEFCFFPEDIQFIEIKPKA